MLHQQDDPHPPWVTFCLYPPISILHLPGCYNHIHHRCKCFADIFSRASGAVRKVVLFIPSLPCRGYHSLLNRVCLRRGRVRGWIAFSRLAENTPKMLMGLSYSGNAQRRCSVGLYRLGIGSGTTMQGLGPLVPVGSNVGFLKTSPSKPKPDLKRAQAQRVAAQSNHNSRLWASLALSWLLASMGPASVPKLNRSGGHMMDGSTDFGFRSGTLRLVDNHQKSLNW